MIVHKEATREEVGYCLDGVCMPAYNYHQETITMKKEEIMQELDKIAREVGKRDRLAFLLEYFDEAIRRYSSMGFTPRGITMLINKLLKSKHKQDRSIPQFVRKIDVVKAMRILGVKPLRGKQKLKGKGKEKAPQTRSGQELPQGTQTQTRLTQEIIPQIFKNEPYF